MSSSINTVCRSHRPALRALSLFAGVLCMTAVVCAQEETLKAPSGAIAGVPASIATSGSGSATFYLIGPAIATKRDVQLGQQISLAGKELQSAGRYVAVVCAGSCTSASFFVAPAKAISMAFLVHPSRAPVGQNGGINGVAVSFDEFHNLVLQPQTIEFQLAAKGGTPVSHKTETQYGAAWFRTTSGKTAGPLQVSASMNGVTTRRVVQEVASEPCRLRIKGQRTKQGIEVETEPVRDCAGNPVPDGTVITFTARSGNETDTVDAPVKQDIARARITADGPVVVSAASGVVMGNQLRIGGHE